MQGQIEAIVSTQAQMESKNNKMDRIQHTQSKAHVNAAAGQKAAVAQLTLSCLSLHNR